MPLNKKGNIAKNTDKLVRVFSLFENQTRSAVHYNKPLEGMRGSAQKAGRTTLSVKREM